LLSGFKDLVGHQETLDFWKPSNFFKNGFGRWLLDLDLVWCWFLFSTVFLRMLGNGFSVLDFMVFPQDLEFKKGS